MRGPKPVPALPIIFLPDRSTRPLEHDAEPRRQQRFGLVVAHPAPFVVLGPAELGRQRQLDVGNARLRDEIARDLAAGIGERVLVRVAEGEVEVGEARFLGGLALCGVELGFAGLDQALGKVPVPVGTQHEQAHAAVGAAKDDGAGGAPRA